VAVWRDSGPGGEPNARVRFLTTRPERKFPPRHESRLVAGQDTSARGRACGLGAEVRALPVSVFDPPKAPEPLSRLAVAALRHLADICNQNNGFVTATEKNFAVRTLRALRFAGNERLDPRAIEKWACTEGGWTEPQAKQLREIAEGVNANRGFRDYDGTPLRRDESVEQAMVVRWRSTPD
jgi:hypothetical protein